VDGDYEIVCHGCVSRAPYGVTPIPDIRVIFAAALPTRQWHNFPQTLRLLHVALISTVLGLARIMHEFQRKRVFGRM